MNLEYARINMIEQQIRPWGIGDQMVLDTMSTIQREQFVPIAYRQLAFADVEIPLGHDEFMMTPRVEARMLQALQITSTDTCLEIGTGSGFVTACMAKLAKHVDSVDIHEDFTQQAAAHLEEQAIHNYTLHPGDALRHWQPEGQYDVIAVTGAVPESMLARLEAWLAVGGRMFVVATGSFTVMHALLLTRQEDGELTRAVLFDTQLRTLVGAEADNRSFFTF